VNPTVIQPCPQGSLLSCAGNIAIPVANQRRIMQVSHDAMPMNYIIKSTRSHDPSLGTDNDEPRGRRPEVKFPLTVPWCNADELYYQVDSVTWSFIKHWQRRAQRTTTGSKISPYCATAHARLVVHMKFRTLKRQVCLPERTWVSIFVSTECLRSEIYFKLLKLKLFLYLSFLLTRF